MTTKLEPDYQKYPPLFAPGCADCGATFMSAWNGSKYQCLKCWFTEEPREKKSWSN